MSTMTRIKAFLGIARAPFLLLPLTLVASGGAAAAIDGAFDWSNTLLALLGLLALHTAVNSLNEASDMRTGIDLNTLRTPFSGGSGTLPSGGLTVEATMAFGLTCAAIGLGVGVWFLSQVGWVLLPICLLGAICVLGYTDWLARLGLGEIAAGFGLGALPIIGTALVQNGEFGTTALAASVPAFFMTFNLLLLNEFPDEQADRTGGRRNLITLFGRRAAARIYALAAVMVPLSIVLFVGMGVLPLLALVALLPQLFLLSPLSWVFRNVAAEEVPIQALGANVQWNLSTNVVLALTLAITYLLQY
jgi:1,4-dihydroxy-2-naphthoate octaprenyltransferase